MFLEVNFSDIFKDSFISNFTNTMSFSTIVFTLLYSFVLSIFVYFIYKLTTKSVIYSKRFNVTMSLMSIITCAVVLSMQSNITVSLGMVGALSIIRFRTSIKEPRDLLFLFWSISNGIIIGSQIYSIALGLFLILSIAMLFFEIIPAKKIPGLIVIYYKNINVNEIEKILNSNKIKFKFKSNNITNKECSCIYEVSVNKNKDFINQILAIKGINEVNLLNQEGETQY